MKDKIDDYMFYKRCKVCCKIIDEDIYDDNNGLCDDCFIDKRTWVDNPFGESRSKDTDDLYFKEMGYEE